LWDLGLEKKKLKKEASNKEEEEDIVLVPSTHISGFRET
jgi:hypothetical protein